MDLLGTIPVPRDIPLPLPADAVLLQALIVLLFLAHIVFVGLMVGGTLLTVVCEWWGRRDSDYRELAQVISGPITVNKSLAVVLGVGPLLAINALYTVYFYSSNALTGYAWISIVPLVTLAFLLIYAHKFSWLTLGRSRPGLHLALGVAAAVVFLCVPLIFLANINLMLFPGQWPNVQGFLSTLVLDNVLPRYVHFVNASLLLTGMFMVAYITRQGFPFEERFQRLTRGQVRRGFYQLTFVNVLLQLAIGLWVLLTLPWHGLTYWMVAVILTGATLAIVASILLAREIWLARERAGRLFVPIAIVLSGVALCMGYGRHLYREGAVAHHREQMGLATDDFGWASAAANWRMMSGIGDPDADLPLGEKVYKAACASCHQVDRVLVGPPLTEIATVYKDNPQGIVTWARNPGKKRADMPQMPAFRLPEENLLAAAEHMLALGSGETDEAGEAPDAAGEAPTESAPGETNAPSATSPVEPAPADDPPQP